MTSNRQPATPISSAEYAQRRTTILERADTSNAGGFVWWGSHRVQYLSGFAFSPTERPLGLIIAKSGESILFVPRLELEHAQEYAYVDRVIDYPEFPDYRHPMELLADLLKELGFTGNFYGDGDGYPSVMGYFGPKLSSITGLEFTPFADQLDQLMHSKSETEIALIRESAYWGGRAHFHLQDQTKVGRSETEVEDLAGAAAGRELRAVYQGRYRALGYGRSGPFAGYRGQIGPHSAFPHALNIDAVFKEGDTLVTYAGCTVFGYRSELERIMFMGDPSEEQIRFFDHATALQELAISLCLPGQPCSSVDKAVREYFDRHGLNEYWRHHVGHNVGLRHHEGPFLDVGDDTIMEPGMLFTVEPGVYVEGLGGFRHSDTILVTDGEPESLTNYPLTISELTIRS